MTTRIALVSFDAKTGRTTVSLDVPIGDTSHVLVVDGARQPGKFVETHWVGALYQHPDGVWGWPGASYGGHTIKIQYRTAAQPLLDTTSLNVGDPPPTLGTDRVWPAENLLPFLWDAGFRSERDLLYGLGIAVGEGGLYTHARNWLPSQGFRPAGDTLGVEGPAAAWNSGHSQQGSSDRGLFQVNWYYHSQYSDAQCDNPAEACRVLFTMTGGGADWSAWGFGAGGEHYSQYFDAAVHGYPALRPLVQTFIASKT